MEFISIARSATPSSGCARPRSCRGHLLHSSPPVVLVAHLPSMASRLRRRTADKSETNVACRPRGKEILPQTLFVLSLSLSLYLSLLPRHPLGERMVRQRGGRGDIWALKKIFCRRDVAVLRRSSHRDPRDGTRGNRTKKKKISIVRVPAEKAMVSLARLYGRPSLPVDVTYLVTLPVWLSSPTTPGRSAGGSAAGVAGEYLCGLGMRAATRETTGALLFSLVSSSLLPRLPVLPLPGLAGVTSPAGSGARNATEPWRNQRREKRERIRGEEARPVRRLRPRRREAAVRGRASAQGALAHNLLTYLST
ncbi:hypothetical protein GGS23DRAFT_377657 [Durotheca rogersii]|uniref:uncharacterized protein n=1 Tax=Durotheca rogersii TaxID=419775 RepID=UPI00221EDB70|nr:uncharacterized protein GGS23DRAFT_377657 [Durotheca rogersii]KAI5866264.1 hypothetical protein GGS23DRAFT_377657 [Durotheca rogersii]